MATREEQQVTLPVRARTVDLGDGQVLGERLACCPMSGESSLLETCRGCERYVADSSGARMGDLGQLVCRVPASPVPAPDARAAIDTVRVQDVMGPWAHCVDADLRLDELAEVLEQRKLREVPVVDEDGVLVGVASRRDLLRAEDEEAPWHLASPSWLGRTVSDVMSTDVHAITEREPLRAALEKMVRHGLQWLPVLTPSRLVVGVLSAEDVLRWLLRAEPAKGDLP